MIKFIFFGSFCSEQNCNFALKSNIVANKLHINEVVFQEMVKFYSETLKLPPLAAKIYAYLIFDFEKRGVNFDEFVEVFGVSKSSVSSNLQLLLNMKIITDFNRIDERRRTFVSNSNFIKIRFEEIEDRINRELEILEELNHFRCSMGAEDIPWYEQYKMLLTKNGLIIRETLKNLYKDEE